MKKGKSQGLLKLLILGFENLPEFEKTQRNFEKVEREFKNLSSKNRLAHLLKTEYFQEKHKKNNVKYPSNYKGLYNKDYIMRFRPYLTR